MYSFPSPGCLKVDRREIWLGISFFLFYSLFLFNVHFLWLIFTLLAGGFSLSLSKYIYVDIFFSFSWLLAGWQVRQMGTIRAAHWPTRRPYHPFCPFAFLSYFPLFLGSLRVAFVLPICLNYFQCFFSFHEGQSEHTHMARKGHLFLALLVAPVSTPFKTVGRSFKLV